MTRTLHDNSFTESPHLGIVSGHHELHPLEQPFVVLPLRNHSVLRARSCDTLLAECSEFSAHILENGDRLFAVLVTLQLLDYCTVGAGGMWVWILVLALISGTMASWVLRQQHMSSCGRLSYFSLLCVYCMMYFLFTLHICSRYTYLKDLNTTLSCTSATISQDITYRPSSKRLRYSRADIESCSSPCLHWFNFDVVNTTAPDLLFVDHRVSSPTSKDLNEKLLNSARSLTPHTLPRSASFHWLIDRTCGLQPFHELDERCVWS